MNTSLSLSELLKKRVIFISGKGRVGKTTVTLLFRLLASKHDKKSLLVEFNSISHLAPIFGVSEITSTETQLAQNLSGINLEPEACFKEYVLKHVKFQLVYKTFFNNKFVSHFINAVPGLNEILMLGKIYELEKQRQSRFSDNTEYDLIIVDAPATGHGLSALEVPQILQSAVKMGPLHKHATQIIDMFSDRSKSAFCLVTLAEEMPVNEYIEYIEALKSKIDIAFGPIFINGVMPSLPDLSKPRSLPQQAELLWNYYRLAHDHADLHQYYINKLNKEFPDFEKVVLPFQFKPLLNTSDYANLLHTLEGAIS